MTQRTRPRSLLIGRLAEAVGAAGVDGGGVLPPAGSAQLVETVAEVLDLAGSQHAAHPHQMPVAPEGPAPSSRPAAPDMTTTPRPPPPTPWRAGQSWRVEPGLAVGAWAMWGRAGGSGRRRGGRGKPLREFEGSGWIQPGDTAAAERWGQRSGQGWGQRSVQKWGQRVGQRFC